MLLLNNKGGSGSGNFGHSGRPGEIGGSGEGGQSSGGVSYTEAKAHYSLADAEELITKNPLSPEVLNCVTSDIGVKGIDNLEKGNFEAAINHFDTLGDLTSQQKWTSISNACYKNVKNINKFNQEWEDYQDEGGEGGSRSKESFMNILREDDKFIDITEQKNMFKSFRENQHDTPWKSANFIYTKGEHMFPNELKLIYGVDNEQDYFKKKTSSEERQIKAYSGRESPRRVNISADECKSLCEATGLEYHTGLEHRVIERVTTTEIADRDGDIVRASGIDNTEYRIEPVVLFAHDRGAMPVGRSIKEWLDKGINGWRSWDVYFDDTNDPTGRSDAVFHMVSSGGMRGGSIGFCPIEAKYDHTEDERKKIGLGKYGVEYKKIRKLEHSACSVPAHQEALANNIKSIDRKIIQGALTVKDLDILEKYCMLDNNMIDAFYSVLGVKRTVFIPTVKSNEGKECTIDYIQKPYPNEHAARIRDPGDFQEDSFRRKKIEDGINIIIGKLKGATTMSTQAYRFDKTKFTADDAKAWLKKNNIKYISFEPAAEKTLDNPVNVSLSLNVEGISEKLADLNNNILKMNEMITTVQKSLTDHVNSIIAIADKAINAIDQSKQSKSFYDKTDIGNILKL